MATGLTLNISFEIIVQYGWRRDDERKSLNKEDSPNLAWEMQGSRGGKASLSKTKRLDPCQMDPVRMKS